MPAFTVKMELKGAGERTLTMYGADRDDVIAYTKHAYRKILKRVKSCRRVKVKPGDGCAARQTGDQMRCSTCDLVWGLDDGTPCPAAA